MPSLGNLQDLRTILERLNAERPAGSGDCQGQTEYQERGGDLLKRLALEVESRPGKARVLVTGQIGVGKSSELWQFFRRQRAASRGSGYWIYCDLEKEEHPERCGATGVILTIFRDCWSATTTLRNEPERHPAIRQEFTRLRDEVLEELIDWLKGRRSEDGSEVVFQFGGMDFPVCLSKKERTLPAYLGEKERALALILGKAAQHEAVSNREERFGLAPDSLINLLNRLLDWIRDAYRGSSPVLIIDHVDKIREEASAREVLVEIAPQWRRLAASVIMTAPFEYTLGEMRHSVESYWGKPLIVYPVPIPELDDTEIPQIYLKIVTGCGLGTLIEPESLVLLAHYSGGILRTFVQFLIDAAKRANLAGHDQIEFVDAQGVVHQAQHAYQDFGSTQIEALDQIAQEGVGLGSAMALLRSPIGLLVMEPERGEQVFRPHPLAENVLERYRFRHGKAVI